jgi:hypothetical protein
MILGGLVSAFAAATAAASDPVPDPLVFVTPNVVAAAGAAVHSSDPATTTNALSRARLRPHDLAIDTPAISAVLQRQRPGRSENLSTVQRRRPTGGATP